MHPKTAILLGLMPMRRFANRPYKKCEAKRQLAVSARCFRLGDLEMLRAQLPACGGNLDAT